MFDAFNESGACVRSAVFWRAERASCRQKLWGGIALVAGLLVLQRDGWLLFFSPVER